MKKWFTGIRLRLVIYGSILLAIAVPTAGYYFEPGSGTFETLYHQIAAGMTQEEIAGILGAKPQTTRYAMFSFEEGKPIPCSYGVWNFEKYGVGPTLFLLPSTKMATPYGNDFRKGTWRKLKHLVL